MITLSHLRIVRSLSLASKSVRTCTGNEQKLMHIISSAAKAARVIKAAQRLNIITHQSSKSYSTITHQSAQRLAGTTYHRSAKAVAGTWLSAKARSKHDTQRLGVMNMVIMISKLHRHFRLAVFEVEVAISCFGEWLRCSHYLFPTSRLMGELDPVSCSAALTVQQIVTIDPDVLMSVFGPY